MTSGSRMKLVATCTRGLEEVLSAELVALGCADATIGRGVVTFTGGAEEIARASLHLRSAMRLLIRLTSGPGGDRGALYALAFAVPWEDVMRRGQTFAVEVAGQTPGFANSAFAGLVVKDALVDRLRAKWGERPDVARADPDLRIHVHLGSDAADISLDTTGEALSKRGWRPRSGPAPLGEALAAGILLLAGFDGERPFLDPMCGTGTLAIEAAMIATARAPGLGRRFAFERWGTVPARIVAEAREAALAMVRPAPAPVVAADADQRAITATRRNASAAGVGGTVTVVHRDVRELEPPGPGAVIVANPPYGRRLGEASELPGLYKAIGDALKRRAAGCTAWLLVGEPELAKRLGLKPARRIVLFNGPIECRLLRFDLWDGPGGSSAAGGCPERPPTPSS